MEPDHRSSQPVGTQTTKAKRVRANKPAPPANFVLPKPVRIPPPPNNRNSQ